MVTTRSSSRIANGGANPLNGAPSADVAEQNDYDAQPLHPDEMPSSFPYKYVLPVEEEEAALADEAEVEREVAVAEGVQVHQEPVQPPNEDGEEDGEERPRKRARKNEKQSNRKSKSKFHVDKNTMPNYWKANNKDRGNGKKVITRKTWSDESNSVLAEAAREVFWQVPEDDDPRWETFWSKVYEKKEDFAHTHRGASKKLSHFLNDMGL
ncbi:hypothetical protein FRB90_012417 [Tulasnella sp. 427]|nr:hypothetical protein FRB90_012417 [Tulasnella sp. 427]